MPRFKFMLLNLGLFQQEKKQSVGLTKKLQILNALTHNQTAIDLLVFILQHRNKTKVAKGFFLKFSFRNTRDSLHFLLRSCAQRNH